MCSLSQRDGNEKEKMDQTRKSIDETEKNKIDKTKTTKKQPTHPHRLQAQKVLAFYDSNK